MFSLTKSTPAMMSEATPKPKRPLPPFIAADNVDQNPAELARIAERNRLIVQVMEINAKQRHLESLQIGLTLEVNRLQKGTDPHLTELTKKLNDVEAQLRRLTSQRDFLETSLAEIDGNPIPPTGPVSGRS
jgi:hypothetical protein